MVNKADHSAPVEAQRCAQCGNTEAFWEHIFPRQGHPFVPAPSPEEPQPAESHSWWRRPWCCPEPRCEPVYQVKDASAKRLDEPQPGQSFACFGRLGSEVTFTYDGEAHANDLRSCFYTPLKGVVTWHENADDWRALSDAYANAVRRLP